MFLVFNLDSGNKKIKSRNRTLGKVYPSIPPIEQIPPLLFHLLLDPLDPDSAIQQEFVDP
jgi:hypothetical protein